MKKFIVLLLVSAIVFAIGLYVGKVKFSASGPAAPPPTFFEGGDGAMAVDLSEKNVIEVKDGESIQDAVGKANPGDLIRVYPGTYHETVYIDKDNISLQGVIQKGKWPTLDGSVDGEAALNDAILYSGSNILIENFKIVLYKGNAIMGQAGNNFLIRNNWIVDAGIYGIFPEFGKNGLIEHNVLSGISDAAIYVGMCDNIDVRHNEVFESVAGIEIENGIKVDAQGRTSDPSIWAAGDCASFPYRGNRIRLESVPNAIDQAELVAENIMGADKDYVPMPWFWSDQYDVKLQIAGLNTGYDKIAVRHTDDAVSSWYYKGDTLLAVDAMNDPRNFMIAKRLIAAGKSPSADAVADPDTDMKALLK